MNTGKQSRSGFISPVAAGCDPRKTRNWRKSALTERRYSRQKTYETASRLTRRLARPLGRWAPSRLDGRSFRAPDHLAEVCRLISRYLRLREKAARRDPHLFGPHAGRYYQDTVRMEREQREIQAALDRVYGPSPEGQQWHPNQVWQERYQIKPGEAQFFR